MKSIIKIVTVLALLAGVAAGVALWHGHRTGSTAKVGEARINDIRDMVKLCTLEIVDEVALKDSINGKWLFAKSRITGRVGFDLERLEFKQRGDTLVVVLPPETVEVRESTATGSYEVIDSWDDTLLGLGKMTSREENALRRRQARRYEAMVYSRGYVRRARVSAVATLTGLLSLMPFPVEVTDPWPEGARLLNPPR